MPANINSVIKHKIKKKNISDRPTLIFLIMNLIYTKSAYYSDSC